jgi:hypothetical protein
VKILNYHCSQNHKLLSWSKSAPAKPRQHSNIPFAKK